MQTYYKILETLRRQLLFDNFVTTVTNGDIFDVDLEKQTLFPLSHIMVNEAVRKDKVYTLNITVLLMDIVDKVSHEATDVFKGNDNEQDVFNTQLAVGARLIEVLKRGDLRNDNYELTGEPNFEPFTERFENSLAGWALTFDVDMPNDMTICDADIVPSDCAAANYSIKDEDGNVLYSGTIESGLSLDQTITDSSVKNSDNSYDAVVTAQGSLTLPDETILVTNSNADIIAQDVNRPSVKNGTIEVPDINFTDSDGATTQKASGIDLVCTPSTPCDPQLYQAAKVMQTGQVTSHTPNDDITRGRDVDFFTLDYVNEWGHSNRFCGLTGGYSDGVSYFDVNGVATTRALAFPDDIVFDFSSRNVNSILSYYIGDVTTARNYQVACSLHVSSTFGGLTGWFLWNMNEMTNVINIDAYDITGQWMGYKPFEFGSGQRYILTSTRSNSGIVIRTDLIATTFIGGSGITSSLFNVFSRYTTLTELGL